MRVVTWNVQWRNSHSPAAHLIRERIFDHEPQIICLTEAPADFLRSAGGFVIESQADYGYALQGCRRKVLLWSATPWRDVDQTGDPELPGGRFVKGTTSTSLGDATAIGVCIPWAAAHVSTGRRDRLRWQDHLQYLEGLERILLGIGARTLVLGDFNQAVPRRTAPGHVFGALDRIMGSRLHLATAGLIEPLKEFSIDHVAHTSDLQAEGVFGLSSRGDQGESLSDHFGVAVEVRPWQLCDEPRTAPECQRSSQSVCG